MNPFLESQKGSGTSQQTPTPQKQVQNQTNILNEFMNFKNSISGDPKAILNQLLATGQVSQQQFNNAVAMANQFKGLFGIK